LPVEAIRADEESAAEKESAQVDTLRTARGAAPRKLLPRYIETQLLRAMARIFRGGTRRAHDRDGIGHQERRDVIDALTLHMNKVRQAAITKEIIEIVSGASYGA